MCFVVFCSASGAVKIGLLARIAVKMSLRDIEAPSSAYMGVGAARFAVGGTEMGKKRTEMGGRGKDSRPETASPKPA